MYEAVIDSVIIYSGPWKISWDEFNLNHVKQHLKFYNKINCYSILSPEYLTELMQYMICALLLGNKKNGI